MTRQKHPEITPSDCLESQEIVDAVLGKYASFQRIKEQMIEFLKSALVNPVQGEQQQPLEQVWTSVHAFDTARSEGMDCENLRRDMMLLGMISRDSSDMSCMDAKLLNDIMTRPIGPGAPSLQQYLAGKVEAGLVVDMLISPNPDFREFNSIQPGLATSTLDYNSAVRTLLFKGAMHLIGIPVGAPNTDVQLTATQSDRKERLQKTMFSFPKRPAEGKEQLKLSDFNAMIDPLDNLGVYESAGPRMP